MEDSEIQLPEVFPDTSQLTLEMEEILNSSLNAAVDNSIGDIDPTARELIRRSILHYPVRHMEPASLLDDMNVISQTIGAILHYQDDILPLICSRPVDTRGFNLARVSVHRGTICVLYKCPNNPAITKYLSMFAESVECSVDGDFLEIRWVFDPEVDHIQYILNSIDSVLTIYRKLLTRFPTCLTYQRSLPGFENS